MSRWLRWGSYAATALILLVIGAALRPVVLPEKHTAAPVLDTTEIGFAQDMTAHHQQAIQMVQRLDPGVDPQVSRLAQQIDQSQRVEIGTMLGWLRLANAAPMSEHPMAWMTAETVATHHHSMSGPSTTPAVTAPVAMMPGMASTAELDRLSAARGRDAEVLFLQLMYRHHQGGIAMARAADRQIASGAVKEQARAMLVAQSQETGLIALLLNQRGAQPLP
ncbi:DUF305 domain-containing protein [Nocardia africana]|uniref:Uncharacterized protein conserved in bacteria n=1 Tax=Nocardia africana TaxID=134964 RepID=A0A378WSU6_9NOCA|nr:DUF305 domain-containing protein [Nocardia africana]MCC3314071.1 DUF305 domain-containing protein [Nocardia africana]SUA43685.1 Uncharacterized protein conserved in bacteria [Nocardia africana]